MSKDALELYSEMFKDILDLPELKVSKRVLEGDDIVAIVAHGLERQYLLGAIGYDPKTSEQVKI